MNIEVWNEVGNRIQNPNDACQFISTLMEDCKDKTFNGLITAHFTNPPSQIYGSVSAFHSECSKKFSVKAIYLEMNGFDINPDRWYFDLFGYESIPPNDDSFDWLSEWQSPDYPTVTLTGLEPIQDLYAHYISNKLYKDKDKAYNEELATLLVMAKFCKLIAESLDNKSLSVPVYATAHDFDIIYHKSA
jgi:hypothetical protein